MFRQARALCPGPQVCGGVDERPATQERLDRRRARRGRHPGPHPAAAQPCRVGHRAGRRCGPRVRRRAPGPRCGADGRRAGRIRPSETRHRDRRGETAVHGLRRAGRERGEHRVLHVCDPRRALPGRRPIWVPAEQLEDPDRRARWASPRMSSSRRNPNWPRQIVADMAADQTMPPWFAGDEVYGRSAAAARLPRDNRAPGTCCAPGATSGSR